jgi:hypothetical protein
MPDERVCGRTLPSMQAVHDDTQGHLLDMPHLWAMRVKKLAHETIKISQANQTPFERFKAAASQVLTYQKPIQKSSKKSGKK